MRMMWLPTFLSVFMCIATSVTADELAHQSDIAPITDVLSILDTYNLLSDSNSYMTDAIKAIVLSCDPHGKVFMDDETAATFIDKTERVYLSSIITCYHIKRADRDYRTRRTGWGYRPGHR